MSSVPLGSGQPFLMSAVEVGRAQLSALTMAEFFALPSGGRRHVQGRHRFDLGVSRQLLASISESIDQQAEGGREVSAVRIVQVVP